jgi:hypothetical protein
MNHANVSRSRRKIPTSTMPGLRELLDDFMEYIDNLFITPCQGVLQRPGPEIHGGILPGRILMPSCFPRYPSR